MDGDLKYAIEHDMINLLDVKEQVYMIKKREILKKYGGCIWYSEKENVWYCHIPDDSKPDGRRKVKRKKKKDIENIVYDFYAPIEFMEERKNATFSDLFFEYMEHKKTQVKSGTISRMMADWNKYYAKEADFIDKPYAEISKVDVDDFLNRIAEKHNPKDKNFKNICGILKQTFEYAIDSDYIDKSPYRTSKVNKKNILPSRKKPNQEAVFSEEEQKLICSEMERQIAKDESYLVPWIILLDFELGTRIGELLALKKSDVNGNMLHVSRQIVHEYDTNDLKNIKVLGWKVADYTKSECGDRWIPLTNKAKYYIESVIRINRKLKRECEDYLFITQNQIISDNAVKDNLRRSCERIGIPYRGTHSIRKTYASRLFKHGVSVSDISRLLGHADETTTLRHYIFGLDDSDTLITKVYEALGCRKNGINTKEAGKVTKSDQKIISFPTSRDPANPHKTLKKRV